MDLTTELYQFTNQYKIHLIGEYNQVKKTTQIIYSCSSCASQVSKSYKILTQYKDFPNVAIYTQFCAKCFKSMHY